MGRLRGGKDGPMGKVADRRDVSTERSKDPSGDRPPAMAFERMSPLQRRPTGASLHWGGARRGMDMLVPLPGKPQEKTPQVGAAVPQSKLSGSSVQASTPRIRRSVRQGERNMPQAPFIMRRGDSCGSLGTDNSRRYPQNLRHCKLYRGPDAVVRRLAVSKLRHRLPGMPQIYAGE